MTTLEQRVKKNLVTEGEQEEALDQKPLYQMIPQQEQPGE